MPQLIFGGILAVVMLGLYCFSVHEAVELARLCLGQNESCRQKLPQNLMLFLNVVGGLISATVVGVLGSTHRGELPAQKSLGKNLTGYTKIIAGLMPSIFILFWLVCGLYMLLYGFITFEHDPLPELTAQAKAWIGTAIGAVYAYLGITPDEKQQNHP